MPRINLAYQTPDIPDPNDREEVNRWLRVQAWNFLCRLAHRGEHDSVRKVITLAERMVAEEALR